MTFPAFRLERAATVITFKEAIHWRFSMVMSLLTGPLFIVIYSIIWHAVYAAAGATTIGGYTYDQMIIYLCVSFSTYYLLWDSADEDIMDAVSEGRLTGRLLKPFSLMHFMFFEKVGHRILAFLIEYIPVAIILGCIFGFQIYQSAHLIYYVLSIPLAFFISFFLNFLIGCSAFWLVKPRGLMWMYRMFGSLMMGKIIPLSLFPPIFQKILLLLPFQFIGYVPGRLFQGSYSLASITNPWHILAIGVIQVIVLYILCKVVWHYGIKRYTGAGA